MKPFTVLCKSCTTKLKVCKPSLINSLHACPKCGEMVKLVPPDGWVSGNETSSPAKASRKREPKKTTKPAAAVRSSSQPVPANAARKPMLQKQNRAKSKSKKRQKQIVVLVASMVGLLMIVGVATAAFVVYSRSDDGNGTASRQLAQNAGELHASDSTEPVSDGQQDELSQTDATPLKVAEPIRVVDAEPESSDLANESASAANNSGTNIKDKGEDKSEEAKVAKPSEPRIPVLEIDPSQLTLEFYQDPDVKNKMKFSDQEGNLYMVENSSGRKAIFIKERGEWLKHGIYYKIIKGNLFSKTTYDRGVKHGAYQRFFPNGSVMIQYLNKAGEIDGLHSQYFSDGSILQEFSYENGKKEGPSIKYHNGPGGSKGIERFVSTYKNNRKDGEVRQYNPEGKLVAKWTYKNGKKVGKTTFY